MSFTSIPPTWRNAMDARAAQVASMSAEQRLKEFGTVHATAGLFARHTPVTPQASTATPAAVNRKKKRS